MAGLARTSLLGCLLIATAALGAETRDGATADPATSRYAISDSEFRRADVQESTDARFRVDARLHPAPVANAPAAGFELRAKLATTAAAVASCSPDYVFANGFE